MKMTKTATTAAVPSGATSGWPGTSDVTNEGLAGWKGDESAGSAAADDRRHRDIRSTVRETSPNALQGITDGHGLRGMVCLYWQPGDELGRPTHEQPHHGDDGDQCQRDHDHGRDPAYVAEA
jgi:hypothetical protein